MFADHLNTWIVYLGQPRNGKGLKMAESIHEEYLYNKKQYDETGILRQIAPNISLSPEYLADKVHYHNADWSDEPVSFFWSKEVVDEETGISKTVYKWDSWKDLITMFGVSIYWDEISILLDSYRYEQLTRTQLYWISHYAKLGNTIVSTTQFWNMLAKRARQSATSVYNISMLFSNRTPSDTRPPVKNLYGLYLGFSLENHKSEESLSEPEYYWFPSFFGTVKRKVIERYDTKERIEPENRIVKDHINVWCEVCGDLHPVHR